MREKDNGEIQKDMPGCIIFKYVISKCWNAQVEEFDCTPPEEE